MTRRIESAYRFTNGQLMVFDENGQQMPEYQGLAEEMIPRLREAGFKGKVQGPMRWASSGR
jgi:hypothetical protein